MLRVWKRNTGQATYAKLLRACVDTSNKDGAQKIVDLLNEQNNRKQCTTVFWESLRWHRLGIASCFQCGIIDQQQTHHK